MKGLKFSILDLGKMYIDMNLIISAFVIGTKSNPTPTAPWDWLPIDSILIDHPEKGKILLDMGCHPDAMNGYWPKSVQELSPYYYEPEQTMEKQLALCGVKPEEIKTIILSHMHIDHSGYLYMFPNAEVYVQRDEFAAALSYAFEKYDQEGRTNYLRKDLQVPIKEYHLFDGDFEVCEGVKILHLPGHTAGTCGLMLELENMGNVIFTRDVAYTKYNYGPPIRISGFTYNVDMCIGAIERVHQLAKENNSTVILGHDKEQYMSMKKAPFFYD